MAIDVYLLQCVIRDCFSILAWYSTMYLQTSELVWLLFPSLVYWVSPYPSLSPFPFLFLRLGFQSYSHWTEEGLFSLVCLLRRQQTSDLIGPHVWVLLEDTVGGG